MKKLLIFAVAIVCTVQFVSAQQTGTNPADYTPTNLKYNYFTNTGTVRLESQELSESADTLVKLLHRSDDIVWSHMVYRVIDLRQKQNYQLYFPDKYESNENIKYRNLLRVLVEALADTATQAKHPIHFYNYNRIDFHPKFTDNYIMTQRALRDVFRVPSEEEEDEEDVVDAFGDVAATFTGLDEVVSVFKFSADSSGVVMGSPEDFENFSRNVVKWCIQEVYYFDKHTARLHETIIAVAPMFARCQSHDASKQQGVMEQLKYSILGWVPYDQFRYYLSRQYVIPSGNDTRRVTFDDFFQQHLYASYIIGDENMFNRVLLNYVTTPEKIKKEQERIAKELLDFEQDLWEN